MKTAHPVSLIRRPLLLASLLLVAGCAGINLPPPEGRSLEERRRTLDEIPAARKSEPTAPGTAQTSGDSGAPLAETSAGDAAASGEQAAATPRSMKDAKALDDPELGIRLPLGIPTLKAGRGNRD